MEINKCFSIESGLCNELIERVDGGRDIVMNNLKEYLDQYFAVRENLAMSVMNSLIAQKTNRDKTIEIPKTRSLIQQRSP